MRKDRQTSKTAPTYGETSSSLAWAVFLELVYVIVYAIFLLWSSPEGWAKTKARVGRYLTRMGHRMTGYGTDLYNEGLDTLGGSNG